MIPARAFHFLLTTVDQRLALNCIRRACAAAVATIAAAWDAAGETNAADSVRLTISAPKAGFYAGEAIKLQLSLTNSGSEPVTIVGRSVWLNYTLSVIDPSGAAVPESAYAARAKEGAEAGFRSIGQIKSGEEVAEMLDLDKMFEMKKPGIYKVRAHRWVSRTKAFEAPLLLGSNELALRIAPLGQGQ